MEVFMSTVNKSECAAELVLSEDGSQGSIHDTPLYKALHAQFGGACDEEVVSQKIKDLIRRKKLESRMKAEVEYAESSLTCILE
jgi:hypothetical protein